MDHDGALCTGSALGQYQVIRVIGRGGFGITYEARDRSLDRRVAIKEYFPSGHAARGRDGTTLTVTQGGDPALFARGLERFLDEARTLAQFRDPRIVHVHGYQQANGTAYMVMDFEEGDSLREHVLAQGVLAPAEARRVLADLLAALQVIHQRGFLHRDVKPGNIIRRPDGSIVLLDFGSARASQGDGGQGYTVMVTPGYAPIEQYDAEGQQGPATDLYAAGACALFCLTGQSPPDGLRRAISLQSGHPDPVDAQLAAIAGRDAAGAELAGVLRALLQTQAGQRPGSAQEVLDRLGPAHDAPARPQLADLARLAAIPPACFEPMRLRLVQEVGDQASPQLFAAVQGAAHAQQVVERLATRIADIARRGALVADLVRLLGEALPPGEASSGRRPAAAASATAYTAVPAAVAHTDEATTQYISSVLAQYIGPIARMLVRKRAAAAASRKDLIEQLEREISDPGQRSDFRKAMQRIADPPTR